MEIKKAEYVKADLLWMKETKYDLKKNTPSDWYSIHLS